LDTHYEQKTKENSKEAINCTIRKKNHWGFFFWKHNIPAEKQTINTE
jgi:hypothetical protein